MRPHRTEKPKNPYITKEDLKRVLIAGNEHDHNSLIIDFDGYLHLIPFNRARGGPYAVRFETFLAGNGYVGSQSSLNHINDTYLSLLEGWLEHLVGHDKIYRNYPSDQTKEKLIEKINEAINNL
ncbi:protein kinase [Bacillus sp. EB600]|nr:protein kinase [Bacillus sp. EB600]